MRFRTIITVFITVLAAVSLLAAPPNLLKVERFDSPGDISTWMKPQVRTSEVNDQIPTWLGLDALGSPDSGAMVLTGAGSISQCVPVTAGKAYDFGARLLITTRDHLETPVAFLKLSFHTDERCFETSIDEVVTDQAVTVPGRFAAVSGKAVVAPQAAKFALVSVVLPFGGNSVQLLPGARRPSVYVDDTFLRETGSCVPDSSTLCFANGKVRASLRFFDSEGLPVNALVVQTSGTTGYFYSGTNADVPEVTIKSYDFSDGGGPKWIVVGGLTNQKLQITVEDLSHHDSRTYTNASGQYLETIVDAFLNP
jgi:hypothetical protein